MLQERNFKKDDIERFEKYQAEALVYKELPLSGLVGLVCYNKVVRDEVEEAAKAAGSDIKIIAQPTWYP